jgi:3-hydroxyacyl-[acyl-carrier-protein] dehydratase
LRDRNHKNDGKWVYYFVGIDGARFKKPVTPGDTLILEIEAGRESRNIAKFKGVAKVNGQLVAEADLLCALRQL